MENRNYLNVYKGPNSVRDYFNPDLTPPLPLVELPDALNPYRQYGVRIFAKMMTMHPANNVKAIPALNLLQNGVKPAKTKTIVEYSSGSTAISMMLISKIFYGLDNVHAFLSNKTSAAKLRLMQFFGLKIKLFGGPAQPQPTDERGGIRAAKRATENDESGWNPDQYENNDNWKSHVRWTGPQILQQLPEINLICSGMGTSGTMTGIGTYFKENKPSVFRLGVSTAEGERVPGPRPLSLLRPLSFPWKSLVDHIEEVSAHDSFSLSLQLCRHGIISGPSSGFNLQGLYQFLERRRVLGTLANLAGEEGEIYCVTLCCDLPYQYIDEYFDKLGPGYFPEIQNSELANVDLFRYDEAWEKQPMEAFMSLYHIEEEAAAKHILDCISWDINSCQLSWKGLFHSVPNAAIVDLRQAEDYGKLSLPGSINIPIVNSGDQSPFTNPTVLATLWNELNKLVKSESGEPCLSQIQGKRLLIVCYDGDSSRVATSVLRANGWEANSICGGIRALFPLDIEHKQI